MQTSNQPAFTVGDHLRVARRHAGFEQADLAARLGVSLRTVGNYERDAVEPQLATLIRWADVCGVDLTWILRARRDSNPQPSDLVLALAVAA